MACHKKDIRPNIIIFYSDELDPSYLSCYGNAFHTPNIDKIASEGVRFTSAYTTSTHVYT